MVAKVLGAGRPLIASFEVQDFESGRNISLKSTLFLDLILDLVDIEDLHGGNIGTAVINGERAATVVDIDTYGEFKKNWFDKIIKESSYYAFSKSKLKSALYAVAAISDESVRNAFYAGVHELQDTMSMLNLRLLFPIDFIFENILLRKHQMEWVLSHFDVVHGFLTPFKAACGNAPINESLKSTDDKYGFLSAAQGN